MAGEASERGEMENRKGNIFHISFMIEFLKVQAPERIQQTSVIISRSLSNSIPRTSVRRTKACLESESLYLASAIHLTSFCLGDTRLQDRRVLLYESPKYVWKIAQGAMRHEVSDVWIIFPTRLLPLKTNLEEEKMLQYQKCELPPFHYKHIMAFFCRCPTSYNPFVFFQPCPSKNPEPATDSSSY